ncbi:MAG: Outer membrane protein assembly factor BamD, partial [Chlamydiae bacterium]|nr:Outer membrane protein assembly factor BamD [Chlamydiota bacterium]
MRAWVLLFVTLCSALGAENHSATPKEALMLRRITEYWKDGDYSTVKHQITDFLDKNPNTGLRDHLSAMLGDLYFQERNFRQALATYDLIADEDVRAKTFFNHLQAHFELKDYRNVIEKSENHLKAGLAAGKDEELKVRFLLAEAAFREALCTKELENKNHYLKVAKPHYKILTQTKYSDRSLFPLAEIHRLLRENDRAAAIYQALAKKFPEHKERFLFQAAILMIGEDKKRALDLFATVYEMSGKRRCLAAFNQLILLHQIEDYEKFISFHAKVAALMPEEKQPLLQFYLGRSYYNMGEYEQAIGPLEAFVEASSGKSKELKTSLMLLINCSRYLKDLPLLERSIYTFKTKFSGDLELPKALLLHAQMSRESGNFTQALNDLKQLAANHPDSEDAASILYDTALLLSQTKSYSEARATFRAFIEKFPSHEKAVAAWRHLVNCCIEDLKSPAGKESLEMRETFLAVLSDALAREGVFNEREKQQYTLVLIKTLCELGKHDEAIPSLSQFISDNHEPMVLAEAHLLMALCHQRKEGDLSTFINHGEKALSYQPNFKENEILHLELYNGYLTLAQQEVESTHKNSVLNQAANHLFDSKAWKEGSIKRENFLWLASHFCKKAQDVSTGTPEDMEKARAIYTELLGTRQSIDHLKISRESLDLEPEIIKFAELMGLYGNQSEQIALLQTLIQRQEAHADLSWKFKDRAVFALGTAYEEAGNLENALQSFHYLVDTKPEAHT